MKVGDLIRKLQEYPENTEISFNYENTSDYGVREEEYLYDPSFRYLDGIGMLEINLFT